MTTQAAKLVRYALDPAEWRERLVDAALPPLAVGMARALKAQMASLGVRLGGPRGRKGDEPGHPFRGNQWTEGQSGGVVGEVSPKEQRELGKLGVCLAREHIQVSEDYDDLSKSQRAMIDQLQSDFSKWDLADWKGRLAMRAAGDPAERRLSSVISGYSQMSRAPELVRGLENVHFELGQTVVLPISDWTTDIDTARQYTSEHGQILHIPPGSVSMPAYAIDRDPAIIDRWMNWGGSFSVERIEGNDVYLSRSGAVRKLFRGPSRTKSSTAFGGLSAKGDVEGHPFRGNQWTGGQGAAAHVMETPEFKAWFGDSKVVDAEGKPLVVYHGTSGDFEEFKGNAWFTSNRELAQQYANAKANETGGEPRVIAVYLSIQRPMPPGEDMTREEVLVAGYDGREMEKGVWVPFSPTQIKSATGNRGTFDPNDPDIRKSTTSLRTKSSTASRWLEENTDDLEELMSLVEEAGIPGMSVLTELPDWMKRMVVDNLRDSFSRDYWDNISQTTAGDAERILERGLQEGESVRAMAEQLVDRLGGDRYAAVRSMNIARTEAKSSLNGARSDVADRLKEDVPDLPMRKTWLSVLGSTTRESHAALHGVPADDDGMWELGGVQVPCPGHPDLDVGERVNCQCTTVMEFGMEDDEARRLIQDYVDRQEEMVLESEASFGGLSAKGDVEGHPFRGNQWTEGQGGGLVGTDDGNREPGSPFYDAAEREYSKDYDPAEYGVPLEAHVFIQAWMYGAPGFLPIKEVVPSDVALKQLGAFVPKQDAVLYRAEVVGRKRTSDLQAWTRSKEFADILVENSQEIEGVKRELRNRRFWPNEMVYDSASLAEKYRKDYGIDEVVVAYGKALKKMQSIRRAKATFGGLSAKGDVEGHPFRGNQWTEGQGGADVDDPETWPKFDVFGKPIHDLYHVTLSSNLASIQKDGFISREGSSVGAPVDTDRVFFATNEQQAQSIVSQFRQGDSSIGVAVVHLRVPAKMLGRLDPRVDVGMPESSVAVRPDRKLSRDFFLDVSVTPGVELDVPKIWRGRMNKENDQ